LSSNERNRELRCRIKRDWSRQDFEKDGEVECEVIEVKTSGTRSCTSRPPGGDWYRIKVSRKLLVFIDCISHLPQQPKSGGDINDVLFGNFPSDLPGLDVIQPNGKLGRSHIRKITEDRVVHVGTFRVMPSVTGSLQLA